VAPYCFNHEVKADPCSKDGQRESMEDEVSRRDWLPYTGLIDDLLCRPCHERQGNREWQKQHGQK